MTDPRQGKRTQVMLRHTPELIRERLCRTRPHYLADFIYGALDGIVTTFAVVSGVAGAQLSSGVIVVLGLANLLGDGFSMAASNYSGTRASEQLRDQARRMEAEEIELFPEGEREEIRQIYAAKGFQGQDLERVVEVITADRERWIETMLTEELGLHLQHRSPLRAAASTLVAFLAFGALPLLPFVLERLDVSTVFSTYASSGLLTAVAFFGVGAAKSRFVEQSWLWAGLETLALGGSAAALAYLMGMGLRGLL